MKKGAVCERTQIFCPMYHKLRLAVSAAARRPLGLYCQQRLLCAPAAPVVRPLQVLLYTYTEDAVEKRKPFREAHLAAANAAVESGELLLGGALADPVDGGLLIFTGDSDPVAFAESDPYVLNGVVTEWTVREWSAVAGALVQQLTPLVSASNFVPCYEWQFLDEVDFDTLPAGLEMELPMDGRRKKARIPPVWQLQVWLEERSTYYRKRVSRATTIAELREGIARMAGAHSVDSVTLRLGDDILDDAQTVESARLFQREGELVVELEVPEP